MPFCDGNGIARSKTVAVSLIDDAHVHPAKGLTESGRPLDRE